MSDVSRSGFREATGEGGRSHPPTTDESSGSLGQRRLSDREFAVYEALNRTAPECADRYLSAVQALAANNVERFVLAAHALRELLDKLPSVVGVEVDRASFDYRSRVGNLRTDWDRAIQNSDRTEDGTSWEGYIDHPLRRLLKRIRVFFKDEERARMPDSERARVFVRGTDPLASELPTSIEEARIKIWQDCKGFVSAVSHHDSRKDASELPAFMVRIEDFLLDHLRPRTTDDQARIAEIIREAEADG